MFVRNGDQAETRARRAHQREGLEQAGARRAGVAAVGTEDEVGARDVESHIGHALIVIEGSRQGARLWTPKCSTTRPSSIGTGAPSSRP